MQLRLVFQYREGSESPQEFTGVFSDKEKAVAACITEMHSVGGPITLNEAFPLETVALPLNWYPLLEPEPAT